MRIPFRLDRLRKIPLKVEAYVGNADIPARVENRPHIMDAVIRERSRRVKIYLRNGRVDLPFGVGSHLHRQVAPCICQNAHDEVTPRICCDFRLRCGFDTSDENRRLNLRLPHHNRGKIHGWPQQQLARQDARNIHGWFQLDAHVICSPLSSRPKVQPVPKASWRLAARRKRLPSRPARPRCFHIP